MTWVLYDGAGRRYGSFETETEAHRTLQVTADERPDVADELVLLAYDDGGQQVGEGVMLEDIAAFAPPTSAATGSVEVDVAGTSSVPVLVAHS